MIIIDIDIGALKLLSGKKSFAEISKNLVRYKSEYNFVKLLK